MATQAQQMEMASIQMQLASSAEQLQLVSNALDLLRHESGNAINDLRRLLAEARSGNKTDRAVNFINVKTYEGGKFTGKIGDYKPWAKRVKIYCNSQCRGFAAALELAEAQTSTVELGRLGMASSPESIAELDEKLYDFLVTYTADEALGNVERFSGNGFEAWRQLKTRYSPGGGRADLDRSLRMLQRKPCKSLSDLPAAIDHLERDLAHHDATSGYKWPEQHKILLLVQMFPEAVAHHLKMSFVADQTDYQKVRDAVLRHANTERLADTYRGAKAMDVDNLEPGEGAWTAKNWEELWEHSEETAEELNYMGKGKGKGKGGKGKGGKGKGKDGKGKDDNKGDGKGRTETRICHWCKKPSHFKEVCRQWLANKPKTAGVSSLEEQGWEEDREVNLECFDVECVDCDPLHEEFEIHSETGDDWTEDTRSTTSPMTSTPSPSKASVGVSVSPSNTSTPLSPTKSMGSPMSPDPWFAYRNSAVAYRNSTDGSAATEPESAVSTLSDQSESVGEIIRKKQEELKHKLAKMARANSLATEESSANSLAAEEQKIQRNDSAASAEAPVVDPPVAPPGMEGLEMRRQARKCKSRQCKAVHEKQTASTETQTAIILPHAMREVLWTASSFEPIVDGNDSDNDETGAPPQSLGVTGIMDYPSDEAQPPKLHMNAETGVGNGVMDLDILEEEEEQANKIYSIHADELYAYVFTMIMLLLILLLNMDMRLKSRGANFSGDENMLDKINESRGKYFQILNESRGKDFQILSKIYDQDAMHDVDISPLSEIDSKMPKERKMRLKRGITIDSGAGNSVMPRRMVLNKSSIRESAGSRAGVNYVPAGGGKIPNEGEFDLAFKTLEGNAETWTFQVAEINKALGAVSQLVDLGYKVIFDKNLETGQDMSYMTHKATNVVSRLRRERNVWVLDAYVSLNTNNSEQGFHRRG